MSINSLTSIAVIGSGTMGTGIAQWFAQKNCKTFLCDVNKEIAKKSVQKIYASWEKLQKKGKFSKEDIINFQKNISPANINEVPLNVELIIEAIVENLEIKVKLFQDLEKLFQRQLLLQIPAVFPLLKCAQLLNERNLF